MVNLYNALFDFEEVDADTIEYLKDLAFTFEYALELMASEMTDESA